MSVQVFMSTQQGAPTVNGVAGSLITMLDAVLVNGYGQVNVSTITRTGVTATVTTATAHGLATGDVALIAGATQGDYNGSFVVTVTGATTFTYDVANSPVTPATGTITCRRAPAGFAKTFSGTNKAVYRAIDTSSRRHFFRFVDDGTTGGGAREARLWGYETMTDVDTGTGIYPTAGQLASGFFCQKSDTADSTAKNWVVISDGKTVYCYMYIGSSVSGGDITSPGANMNAFGFGDAIEFRPGDAGMSWVTGAPTSNQFSSTQYSGLFNTTPSISSSNPSGANAPIMMARDFTGVAGARATQLFGTGLTGSLGGTSPLINYPHQVDNGFYMVPCVLTQSSPAVIRGRMPGYFEPLHGNCFPNTQIIENVIGYAGRRFMMLWGKNSSSPGAAVVDITGPWDS
jgi:hypothetical protein